MTCDGRRFWSWSLTNSKAIHLYVCLIKACSIILKKVDQMNVCPHCGKSLKLHLLKGAPIKKRPKKDPNELMTEKQFKEGCWTNKQRHIQIIGHYADELKLNGEYTNRKQWKRFLDRNLKPARMLSDFDDKQISDAMKNVKCALRTNGGYMDKFTLETVFKFLVK